MPAALTIATTTGSEQLLLGAYYTQNAGSASAIQALDYTTSTYWQSLLLNPQGGDVLINAPGSINNTTGLLLRTSGLDFVIQNNNTGRLYFNTNNTNVIQIQGGGSSGTGIVGINGGPIANYALNVNGNILASGVTASGVTASGNITATNGNITAINGTISSNFNAGPIYASNTISAYSSIYSTNGNMSASDITASATLSGYNITATNNISAGAAVTAYSFNASSDYRIKDNVLQLDETFSVDNLKPVSYYNKNLKKKDIGLIAHELQEVYPELVTGEKDGENMQSVNYTGLIPILIKEIQDLKTRVKELELKNII
jgi:hypothetical protein